MLNSRHTSLAITAAIALILPAILPNDFYLDLAIRMAMNAVVVLALNMLIGQAGQISMGHVGFIGIGAYASAVLPVHFGVSPWLAILLGAFGSAALAAVVARPIFRLKGHYLAMATLGLGIMIDIALRNQSALTGGPDGMSVPALSLAGHVLASERTWYWTSVALLLVALWVSLNLIDSPFGRALRALHGSEVAAQVMGIDVPRHKSVVFIISAVVASVMGSAYAVYVGFITPSVADFMRSIEFITMVVVGGMASVYGSLIGAIVLTALPDALTKLEGGSTVVFGTLLIVCMIYLPRGIVPTLAARLRRSFRNESA